MVASIAKTINECFETIEGRDTLLCQQNQHPNALCSELWEKTNIILISTEVDILTFAADGDVLQISNGLYVTGAGIKSFVKVLSF